MDMFLKAEAKKKAERGMIAPKFRSHGRRQDRKVYQLLTCGFGVPFLHGRCRNTLAKMVGDSK